MNGWVTINVSLLYRIGKMQGCGKGISVNMLKKRFMWCESPWITGKAVPIRPFYQTNVNLPAMWLQDGRSADIKYRHCKAGKYSLHTKMEEES